MKSLGQALVRHYENRVILLNRAQCSGCGWFNTEDWEVRLAMEIAGRPLHLAARPNWKTCPLQKNCKATNNDALYTPS